MAKHSEQPFSTAGRSPADDKARVERLESRIKLASALVALLTALVTALVVVAGVYTKKANDANEQADSSQDQIQQLKKENDALRQQIARLEQATPSAGASPSSESPSSDADSPLVRHKGPLVLIDYSSAHFDALPDDPQWGTTGALNGRDVTFHAGGGLEMWDGAKWATLSGTLTYEACRSAQPYANSDMPYTLLQRTSAFCILTNGGRQAAIQVKKVTGTELDLEITTYSKAGD